MDIVFFHHYQREDFACKCGCQFDTIDHELAEVFILLKYLFWEKSIKIHGGCRCWFRHKTIYKELNDEIMETNKLLEKNGEPLEPLLVMPRKSLHLKGKAADFHINGIANKLVYDTMCEEFKGKYGIRLYAWGIHVDVRGREHRKELV